MSNQPAIYELGPDFYDVVSSAPFPEVRLRYRNEAAAQKLGLDSLDEAAWLRHFAYFEAFPGNIEAPLALRYHGHQFSHYNPDLGDGRGFLFAQFGVESANARTSKLFDLGTKGSGQTPYSRRGDGRLTLKGAYREILATELLKSYGINTSETFSVIETGEKLERQDEPSPTRSAVLVRLCQGHLRFGTFQRLAFFGDAKNIQKLAAYCLRHYYPELKAAPFDASLFFKAVIERSVDLVASWMTAGFVHGVMNTDNMNISGECFDYGPYRFLPHYDPDFTAAYFDQQGLYRFGRQPVTMLWNLEQLGQALLVGFPDLPVADVLSDFGEQFNERIIAQLLKRLNLLSNEHDQELLIAFFGFLEASRAGYEQSYFDLFGGLNPERLKKSAQSALYELPSFEPLATALKKFTAADAQKNQHPYFQQGQACHLLIEEIESIWSDIADRDDWAAFEKKLAQIRSFRGVYG